MGRHEPKIRPDDVIAAETTNWIASQLEKADGLNVVPPLEMLRSQDGRLVRLAQSKAIRARLTSGTSPYSWQEIIPQSGGTYVDGPRSGTSNAYEVNGKAATSGYKTTLYPGYPGDWRFQMVKRGSSGPVTTCCGGATLPATPTCTYARYDISSTLIAGPATVGMTFLSEVAFSGCTSRGPGYRTTAPLDPAVYAYPDPWDGIDRYLVIRCNVISFFEMRIISPFSNCFYGPPFNPVSTCSPFFLQGKDATPGLSPYNQYTITP